MSRSRITANALTTNNVVVLDDIGYLFNDVRNSFPLTVGGTAYTVTDGYQLAIYLGAHLLKPYITVVDNVYLGVTITGRQGYTVSGSTITFLNSPTRNIPFYGRILSSSPSFNTPVTVKNVFSPLNILLS